MRAQAWTSVVRLSLLGLLFAASSAQAVVSCVTVATSFSVNFNPAGPTDLVVSSSFIISCTRAGGDPASVAYTFASDNGLHFQGGSRNVQLGAATYSYGLHKDAGASPSQPWGTAPPPAREFSGTIEFGAGTSVAFSTPFYLKIATGQKVGPAGIYTDTVATTLTYGTATYLGAFNVNVNSVTTCTLTAPANVTFNYASFQAAPAAASANFTVNCTTGLPYTMALDQTAVTDNAVNLAYSLSLSAAGGTGIGVNQTHAVNGTMASGQAGTCASGTCNNSGATNRTRTLTISW